MIIYAWWCSQSFVFFYAEGCSSCFFTTLKGSSVTLFKTLQTKLVIERRLLLMYQNLSNLPLAPNLKKFNPRPDLKIFSQELAQRHLLTSAYCSLFKLKLLLVFCISQSFAAPATWEIIYAITLTACDFLCLF